MMEAKIMRAKRNDYEIPVFLLTTNVVFIIAIVVISWSFISFPQSDTHRSNVALRNFAIVNFENGSSHNTNNMFLGHSDSNINTTRMPAMPTNSVILHHAPSRYSGIGGIIETGSKVRILAIRNDGWVLVQANRTIGWLPSTLLTMMYEDLQMVVR